MFRSIYTRQPAFLNTDQRLRPSLFIAYIFILNRRPRPARSCRCIRLRSPIPLPAAAASLTFPCGIPSALFRSVYYLLSFFISSKVTSNSRNPVDCSVKKIILQNRKNHKEVSDSILIIKKPGNCPGFGVLLNSLIPNGLF